MRTIQTAYYLYIVTYFSRIVCWTRLRGLVLRSQCFILLISIPEFYPPLVWFVNKLVNATVFVLLTGSTFYSFSDYSLKQVGGMAKPLRRTLNSIQTNGKCFIFLMSIKIHSWTQRDISSSTSAIVCQKYYNTSATHSVHIHLFCTNSVSWFRHTDFPFPLSTYVRRARLSSTSPTWNFPVVGTPQKTDSAIFQFNVQRICNQTRTTFVTILCSAYV